MLSTDQSLRDKLAAQMTHQGDPRATADVRTPNQMLVDARDLKFNDYWEPGDNSWATVAPALLGGLLMGQ